MDLLAYNVGSFINWPPVFKAKSQIMNPIGWNKKDYAIAYIFLSENEDESESATVLETGKDVSVILPQGLPALGVGFLGLFMSAPILVFMVILLLFPVLGFTGPWELNRNTVAITLTCGLLLFGFVKVVRLMLKNRDLFPRKYFVTLGNQGIAMHFSRLHVPSNNPKTAIPWERVRSVKKSSSLFLMALFLGRPIVASVEVESSDGRKLIIPVPLEKSGKLMEAERIINLIQKKMKMKGV